MALVAYQRIGRMCRQTYRVTNMMRAGISNKTMTDMVNSRYNIDRRVW